MPLLVQAPVKTTQACLKLAPVLYGCISMIKSLMRLILIQATLFLASTSLGANEYARPVIFSGAGLPYARCKIVTIHSLTEVKGQVYSQSGVGWFISGEEGYRLLTPAHVVSGADAVLGECLGKFFPLQVQSRSETLDLALLKPMSDVTRLAYPLIYLKTREQAMAGMTPAELNGLKTFHPDHFARTLESLINIQESNSYQLPGPTPENPVIKVMSSDLDIGKMGIAHYEDGVNSLVVETLGIQPGYSGVPLFAHIQKQNFTDADFLINTLSGDGDYSALFLMGMLTRTEVNGSRSLGISLPMILKALPYLMKSQNPTGDAYAQGVGLRLQLEYLNTLKNKVMERSQVLVDDTSGTRKIFTEICQDESIESSEWSANSAASSQSLSKLIQQYKSTVSESQKRPQLEQVIERYKAQSQDLRSIQQKSRGGDYGEGGGSIASLKNGQLMTPDRNIYYHGGYYTLTAYKMNKPCQKVALQDNQGRIFDSLILQGRLKRATSVADAFNAISRGGMLTTSRSAPLCKNLTLFASEMDAVESWYVGPNKENFIHARSEGIAMNDALKKDLSRAGEMRCAIENSANGPTDRIDIRLEQEYMKMQVSLGDLKNPKGFIQLKNPACIVQLSPKNYSIANRWKHQIRSPMMDVDFILNTEDRVLSIKVLRASESCSPSGTMRLWLQEAHFFDIDSMAKKSNSWRRSYYEKKKAGIY
jgi:hypothetical protein